jgi:hypothetical protein
MSSPQVGSCFRPYYRLYLFPFKIGVLLISSLGILVLSGCFNGSLFMKLQQFFFVILRTLRQASPI